MIKIIIERYKINRLKSKGMSYHEALANLKGISIK